MSIRYLSNLALILAGAFLVVATQAFTPTTAAALTFALAIGFAVISLSMVVSRGIVQRAIGGTTFVISAWTIVASLLYVPTTALWLGFAAALAVVGLGVVGLTAHELGTERVVHSINVEQAPARGEHQPVVA